MKHLAQSKEFTATQWFEPGDHDAVYPRPGSTVGDHIVQAQNRSAGFDIMRPGMWIVELGPHLLLFRDNEFRQMFDLKQAVANE